MRLPFGLVNEKIQDAWDEYHRTPSDFARVEPFFITAINGGGVSAKFNYTKFIGQFDKPRALQMFRELSKQHVPSMYYYARELTFVGSKYQKRKAVILLKKSASEGHLLSSVFLQYAS